MTTTPQPEVQAAVSVREVSKRFGPKLALDAVNLEVTRGQVFGLVGGNGAGKTTLIKHLLGLYRPASGAVRVFGENPVANPTSVLARIGFLSEDRDLPPWMQVRELLQYNSAFYPKWDWGYAQELCGQFQLEPLAYVRHLSRGELAKAGLLLALAHRPDLLLLDEPSSGLDPLVRREMLEAVVRTVADEGRTVIFSSHLLDEIERVSDQIAIMANGRIMLQGPLADILESHHRLILRFPSPLPAPPSLRGVLSVTGSGLEWTVLCNGGRPEVVAAARGLGAQIVAEETASLDEIFLARVGQRATHTEL